MPSNHRNAKLLLERTELLVFLGFVALGLANILAHEMWRDEFQAFLIAKESVSLPDLFQRAGYEGHPPLWFLSLFAITRITADPLAMQIFHLFIASLSALLIIKLPVPAWLRYPLVFGYFTVYEYLAISRNYAVGLFLCLVLLKLLTAERRNNALIALALFLLCFTSVYGMILAAAIAFYLALDSGFPRRNALTTAAIVFVLLAGLGLSAAITMPPPDSDVETAQWFFSLDVTRAARVITAIWKSYVPIPELNGNFWDTHLLESRPLRVLASLLILAGGLLMFLPRRNIFLFFSFGTLSLFLFSYFKFVGYLRHQGHFFILFLMCLALMFRDERARPVKAAARAFVIGILVVQIVAGAAASVLGWIHPFTAAKAAAQYINARGFDDRLIIGDRDYALTSIAGYLGRPVLQLSSMRLGTYIIWDRRRTKKLEPREIVACANRIAAEQGRRVLLVLNYPLPPAETGNLVRIAEFTRSVKKDETYFLYIINGPLPLPLFKEEPEGIFH